MDFDQTINFEKECRDLENSIKAGLDAKARNIFMKIINNNVFLQINIEEKIFKSQPDLQRHSLNSNKNEGLLFIKAISLIKF